MGSRSLRRKLTFRANGATLVLVKRPEEKEEHVLQKALLWALYLPRYRTLRVEVPLPFPSRYKPDLLAMDGEQLLFWAECGATATDKLTDILRRYRATHFVFSKYAGRTSGAHPFTRSIALALQGLKRSAPVEFICFDESSARFVREDGTIDLQPEQIKIERWAS
jgi:hypothetical protein